MRFAFISTMGDLPWGGSEELWSQSASHLRKLGHQVFASVFHWSQNASRLRRWREEGIIVEGRPGQEATAPQRAMRKLAGRQAEFAGLRRFAPDLVLISQGYNRGGFDWARVCREADIPYAILVHCNSDLWWFPDRDLIDANCAYTFSRRVFCVSRANLDLLRLQVGDPLSNASVVWNPCNVSRDPAPPWPTSDSKLRLASVARLVPEAKGQDILLRVLAETRWRERNVQLDLFGTGPYAEQLRNLATSLRLQNVTFCGQVGDIRSIWRDHHLMVLASRFEGLPLSLIEAMWCARPAVVTDVGGNSEICSDGEMGFIASAAAVAPFSDALDLAWNRRAELEHMGKAARTRIEVLVPDDPIAVFCQQLKACVDNRSSEGL